MNWFQEYHRYVDLRLKSRVQKDEPMSCPEHALYICLSEPTKAFETIIKNLVLCQKVERAKEFLPFWSSCEKEYGPELRHLETAAKKASEGGPLLENAYHAALYLISSPTMPTGTYLSDNGLFPELVADQSFECDLFSQEFSDHLVRLGAIYESIHLSHRPTHHIYRGQRKVSYDLSPKLFRYPRDQGNRIWCRLNRSSELLSSHLNCKNDIEKFAVLQHYSEIDEESFSTHLLDFTLEPLVALFFASDHGQDGDVGVIFDFSLAALQDLGSGTDGLLGFPQGVFPANVPRISRQRGVFLSSPNPEALFQLVPRTILFKQQPDLPFIDKRRRLTREHLLETEFLRSELESISDDVKSSQIDTNCSFPASPFDEIHLLRWLEEQVKDIYPIPSKFSKLSQFHCNLSLDDQVKMLGHESWSVRSLRHFCQVGLDMCAQIEFGNSIDGTWIPDQYVAQIGFLGCEQAEETLRQRCLNVWAKIV